MRTISWSKPYLGYTHCGEFSTQTAWATVKNYGSFAELFKWFPGCGFSPITERYDSERAAKQEAESWLKTQHGWQSYCDVK